MSIFNKNNKKKIALAVACASILSGKISLAAQNIDKVGGAVASSKKMSKLTKGLIIGGSVLGAAELINEGVGIFTNADAWYKGKFSVANGIKHILATTPEERKILTQKILEVVDSFPNVDKIDLSEKYKAYQGKDSNLDEVLSRVEIEFSKRNNKLRCIEYAQDIMNLRDILTGDEKKINEFLEHEKARIGYTANGFTLKSRTDQLEVKYTTNSIMLFNFHEEDDEKGKSFGTFIMNNDGSLTCELKIEEYSNGKFTDVQDEHEKFTLKPKQKRHC